MTCITTRHQRQPSHFTTFLVLMLNTSLALAQDGKRGLAYIGSSHTPDTNLLSSSASPLSWYYNWGPYPGLQTDASNLEFMPMIHGLDAVQDSQTESAIASSPSSSTHLLSFNEPDGTQDSGGSKISAEDAAKAYHDYVLPFRNGSRGGGRKWKISHPVTTGSGSGVDWLRAFNASCYEIDAQNGCPTDFIAVHWYGNFDGLAAWLGTINEFYNVNASMSLKLWVTELGLPQQDADVTADMMNRTLPYLDGLEYVERYSWFGAFRTSDANEWTGNGVALFDSDGGLTEVGALYMGDGFEKGQKGQGNTSGVEGRRVGWGVLVGLVGVGVWFGGVL
ncbi:glycoside hydrolase family 128 protein [Dothidotthia symphoricarpi CBS 119687]|uniref:Glycoside hydrolase family 128 protein n=1 Tax=Dothidotthia symphoricarpi CBS 119687 TaxID=1392245 RepID=A0A6A6A117_9PLEO|nr:glycoside hydrolase family 128 protein [Dothidotthia symphoricarpi CBS 119687]KAF2124657.1 glycoside hydrolase family 128 protein [Dothidotthia symphoricarpi CBS 119687]